MTAHARWEYGKAIYTRYRRAPRREKQQLLGECCRITRYHRKHAVPSVDTQIRPLCSALHNGRYVERRIMLSTSGMRAANGPAGRGDST